MKLLSVAIPSYNSQDYLAHAVESLLPGGDEVEILIVNDGSKDNTAKIADEYEAKYPGIVRAIHKENGGHGDAVMTGLKNASGLYFKVVDSDDWVDEEAYPKLLATLRELSPAEKQVDMVVSNYIYDKVGVTHKKVISYGNALLESRVLSWDDVGRFHIGQYILMHAAVYRTELLRSCGLSLPKHTFYVDNLYVYQPMLAVKTLYYLNVNLYHYYIGRDDQSVQEDVMIRRIDQQLLVNRLMLDCVNPDEIPHKKQRKYMRNYLEIVTTVSSVLLIKSGTPENLAKKQGLWDYIKEHQPKTYQLLCLRPLGAACHIPGRLGRRIVIEGYKLSKRIFGFN